MAITLVQSAEGASNNTTDNVIVTLPGAPTVGNTLVAFGVVRQVGRSWSTPAGWTLIGHAEAYPDNGCSADMFYRVVQSGDPAALTLVTVADYKYAWVAEFTSCDFVTWGRAHQAGYNGSGPWTIGPVAAADDTSLGVAGFAGTRNFLITPTFTAGSGWTQIQQGNVDSGIMGLGEYRAAGAGAMTAEATFTPDGNDRSFGGILAIFGTASVPGDPPLEPPYVAPLPGAAVVEIYAAEPGAYRWGSAIWGAPSVWSTAGWRDVTPESVDIEILWGSGRPELGILSKVEPASWAIEFHDPDRALDPANAEGPYYGDLEPGLPVRVRHSELVVKQGVAESIGYEHSREWGAQDRAYMRVTDVVSVMANATVPPDVTLSDTLWARAADAIAAAGLSVTMLSVPVAGDPVLAPWVTGQDRSAWEWIVDAAESVLYVPIVTNLGYLGFRPYSEPLDRGRRLASPNLVGLQSIIAHNGLYSVVTALQSPGDGGAVITRELTPKPRYGARQYDRGEVTPNAGDWALAVLSDRSTAGLRWVPGEVYPLTAADVTYFAEIEGMERVGIYYPEADPAVVQDVIVVGGRITVTAKKDSEAIWSFEYQAAQSAPSPLIDDDTGTTLLARDDDPTQLLYPDG